MVVLAALVCLAVQDSTPATDTTPFRRGQWAAQFSGGSSFGSLGFVKFRSPTRAVVLDLRLSGSHGEQLVTDSTGTYFAALESRADVDLRVGLRRYRREEAGEKIVSHYSLGVLAGVSHSAGGTRFGSSALNGWRAGVFGDLGASYLITPHFGIGATAGVTITYATFLSRSTSQSKFRTWQVGGNAPNAAFVATLYF